MRLLLPERRELADEELPDLYAPEGSQSLRAGFVVGLDGGVAAGGTSAALSGPADRAVLRALRTVSDAVLVGAGTARAEDMAPLRFRPSAAAWRAAHGRDPAPPVVVVSRSGRLDPAARLFAGPGPVLLVVPEQAQVPVLAAGVVRAGRREVDLDLALEQLRGRGLGHLVCEGGPSLLTDLLASGHVGELCLTSSPQLGAAGPSLLTRALPTPARLRLRSLVTDEPGFLMARYLVVPDPPAGPPGAGLSP